MIKYEPSSYYNCLMLKSDVLTLSFNNVPWEEICENWYLEKCLWNFPFELLSRQKQFLNLPIAAHLLWKILKIKFVNYCWKSLFFGIFSRNWYHRCWDLWKYYAFCCGNTLLESSTYDLYCGLFNKSATFLIFQRLFLFHFRLIDFLCEIYSNGVVNCSQTKFVAIKLVLLVFFLFFCLPDFLSDPFDFVSLKMG